METGDERGNMTQRPTPKWRGLDPYLDWQVLHLFWPKLE